MSNKKMVNLKTIAESRIKPSDLELIFPEESESCKFEEEAFAQLIMGALSLAGNKFREMPYEEFLILTREEEEEDLEGQDEICYRIIYNRLVKNHLSTALKAAKYSPRWMEVFVAHQATNN